eukprot:8729772-Alexandrium_andersonii.AAC.1
MRSGLASPSCQADGGVGRRAVCTLPVRSCQAPGQWRDTAAVPSVGGDQPEGRPQHCRREAATHL